MPDGTLNSGAPLNASPGPAVAPDCGCFHCGLALPADGTRPWRVLIDGASRAMCCPGCAAVAETIVALGQGAYYRERSAFAARGPDTELPPALALYENADPRFGSDADVCVATLAVEGIRCAACVWLIERRLLALPGVRSACLNVATERLQLRWERERCTLAGILAALHAIGYGAYPYEAGRHGEQLRLSARTLGRQLFVAGLSMMQVMMYVAPAYLADAGTLDDSMAGLMRWASLLLTIPAVCYSAQPFFSGALASLRARTLNMDVPVALGIGAAFGASMVATWRGTGEVYFDSVTMFVFLLLCSRYLELRARRQAAAGLQRLQHALPASASRLNGYPARREATLVPAAALAAGDVILIKPGEAAAADCRMLEGCSGFDLSLLTGESAPQLCMPGQEVQGGAINIGGMVLARVLRPSADSTLSDLIRLVEQADRQKPRIAQWADQVAAWFVAGLLLFALACLAFWLWHDAARAWPVAIAVLVVSCPCALSLATPSALAAATDQLLWRGVLVVGPQTLETLRRASHIIFDKTGTLTEGRPQLQNVRTLRELDQATCLRIAAALETGSLHPLARAVMEAAAALPPKAAMSAQAVTEVAGQGLEGQVAGVRYRLGNSAFAAGLYGVPARLDAPAGTGARPAPVNMPAALNVAPFQADVPQGMNALYLADEHGPLACLLLHDALRADARATVDYFRAAGKTVLVLSGDDETLTRRVASDLGISQAYGGCLPADKLAFVRALQTGGAVVAMVGDGINDAAVLSAADVSFAMGAGAALAQAHADAVLLSGRLGSVADMARVATRTMTVIRQNLAWAMLYNALAIPAAAFGLLNPWLSGAGMACSSVVVLLNALRLRKGA